MTTSSRLGLIELADHQKIASGRVRDVWPRPGHPDEVLKTIVERKRLKYAGRTGVMAAHARNTLGPYRTFWTEYKEYARVAVKAVSEGRPNPIVELGGFVQTNRGLAQVCKRVRGADGTQARTLRKIFDGGEMNDHLTDRLTSFAQDLIALNVSAPDLSSANVMFDDTDDRFLLVDGFGEKTVFPIRRHLPQINRRRMERWLSNYAVDTLSWSTETKSFTLLR